MCLNKFVVVSLLLSSLVRAQVNNVQQDSIRINNLEEVVVTGQLRPQSIKKSVFEVKVITSKEIENRAGNNLADLLSQVLNIDVFQNASSGKSEINVLGLDGKYFKVLIDNIPIVNEEGFGNNTDLTLINLDDVERIELVQGAMGVQYGANALSGVLNIITKKSSKYKWQAKTFIQEETVGNEYEFFNQGRHIQSLNIGHKLTDEDYINVSYSRNDFRGFLGSYKGKYHDEDDNLRGNSWLPKTQNFAKLLFSHKKENLSFFYKFDYLYENISSYDSIVRPNFITSTQTSNPSSFDKRFRNERFVHHTNITGNLGDVLYNISASYQQQQKKRESFTYYIREDEKDNIEDALYLSKKVWYSRGSFSNLIHTDKFNLQGGYDFTNESGYSSPEGTTIAVTEESVSNTLRNFDVFASSEIIFSESFAVKPGIRTSFTNLFGKQFYYGVSARKLLKNDWEARAILGYSTRTPNFDELYTYFVDVNHDIQGNENLNPEKGLSSFFHLKKRTTVTDDFLVNNKITLSFIKANERIELITINETPLQSEYNNIDEFSSLGTSLDNNIYYKNLKLNIGVSYFGVQKILDYGSGELSPYQGNFQFNTNFTYTIPKIATSLTGYYKYIGETNRFLLVDGSYENQIINPYSWLDVTANKKFLNKRLDVTLGARNLLNVVDVNTNTVSNGSHSGSEDSISLGYGRSFFLKLGYNFKI